MAEHGAEIKVDGKRLAVAGNSVGGNMAAVVALMAKNKGTPAIRFGSLPPNLLQNRARPSPR